MVHKILIADASPSMCTLIENYLRPLEAEVERVHSGEECIEKASCWTPDLITVDVVMPDISGLDVCSMLKQLPHTYSIPVLITTALKDEETRKRALEIGARDFLVKPFTQDFMLDRIRTVLADVEAVSRKHKVLVAEDSRPVMSIYKSLLSQIGCDCIPCADGQIAWDALQESADEVDLVVFDLNMPNMDGRELSRMIRSDRRFDPIPLIVSTIVSDSSEIKDLFTLGANDYIIKPFSHEEFNARISAHLRTRKLLKEQERLNLQLKTLNEHLEEKVRRRTREIREANIEAIFMLALASDSKDKDTANHIQRVRRYCDALARKMGYDEEEAEEIGYSSMMHDVGKIATPDDILNKPGQLSKDEFKVMMRHTLAGANILGDKPFFEKARQIAHYHHEWYDGSGYPEGRRENEIPLAARIVTVADVYDALTSKRVYKDAWTEERAVAELKKSSGTHLDPHVVMHFLEMIKDGTVKKIRSLFPT